MGVVVRLLEDDRGRAVCCAVSASGLAECVGVVADVDRLAGDVEAVVLGRLTAADVDEVEVFAVGRRVGRKAHALPTCMARWTGEVTVTVGQVDAGGAGADGDDVRGGSAGERTRAFAGAVVAGGGDDDDAGVDRVLAGLLERVVGTGRGRPGSC